MPKAKTRMCNACKERQLLTAYDKKPNDSYELNCRECMSRLFIEIESDGGSIVMHRECFGCSEVKPLTTEYFRLRTDQDGSNRFRGKCRECQNADALETSPNQVKMIEKFISSDKIIVCIDCKEPKSAEHYVVERAADKLYISKERCEECVDKREAANQRKYVEANREKIRELQRQGRIDKIDEIREKDRVRSKERHEDGMLDPGYRIRQSLSSQIGRALREHETRKNGSISDYLPYTLEELLKHIENLFEPWMNWDNYGKYNAMDWDEEDSSTWTWPLDHIRAQSTFHYKTMDCQEFRECWALSNLRPYQARKNIAEGDRT